jgi:hypothetical protein
LPSWSGVGWIATPVASVERQNAVAIASARAASTMQPSVAPTCSA